MEKTFAAISRSLSGQMLSNAFGLLRPWILELSTTDVMSSGWSDRFQSLQQNYQYLADYFLSGEDDPRRSDVLQGLTREAYILADEAYLSKRLEGSYTYEMGQMHYFASIPHSPYVASEDDLNGPPQVFQFFWLCKHLEDFDLEVLEQYIANPKMEEEAQLGISGLTLNLLRCFSETGVLFLLKICGGKYATTILERSWVGLMLVMMHYDHRLRFFPSVTNAFQDLIATEEGSAFALAAFSSLVRTSGVEWAGQSFTKLQGQLMQFVNEKMPFLKKDGKKEINISIEDLDDFGRGLSDDFRKMMSKRGDEVLKLREQHLDANFAVFRHMYATPFFSDPFHWWLPFDTDYLSKKELDTASKLGEYFPPDICDSDRYAMITAIASLSSSGIPAGTMPEVGDKQQQLICNSYTQQVYRFFVLNPWSIGKDIFNEVNELPESGLLKMLRPSSQDKIRVADQFLTCHAYELALKLYEAYAESVNTKKTWRNYALCLQKTKQYRKALQVYDRLNLTKKTAENEWIMRQKVWCMLQSEICAYDDACQVLDQLIAFRPDNTDYLFEKGKCLERLELYLEALELYYKIDILQPGNRKVLRSIAWCSFISGQMEQAQSYYEKLMGFENVQMIDYLNYGHFLFVQGARMEAFHYYQEALHQYDNNIKDFLTVFRPDRRILLEKGVPIPDIYLMEDQLIAVSRHM